MKTTENAKRKATTNNTSSLLITLNTRSYTMKQNSIFRRGMSALVALVLFVGLAMSQDFVIVNGSTITNSGTIKVKGNITNAGVASATTIGGTVQLKANAVQSIGTAASTAINFANLVIPASAGAAKTFNVASTIATSIDIAAAANASSSYDLNGQTLTLQGSIANTGGATIPYVFSGASSTVDYDGGAQNVWGSSGFTYYNLTVSNAGDKTMVGDVTASNNISATAGALLINGNTLTAGGTYNISGGSVTGGATSNIVLNGSGDLATFVVTNGLNNLTLNRAANTVTLSSGLTLAGAATLTAGTLHVDAGQTLTLNGSGSVVTGAGSLTSNATGTVDYALNSQNIFAANYGNLSLTLGDKTFPNSTVGIAETYTVGGGTHGYGTGTVDFNGASQSIPAVAAFYNLTTSGSGTKTAGGNIGLTNNLLNGSGITLTMGTNSLTLGGGSTTNTGGTIQFAGATNGLAINSGTIEYNGTIAQEITAGTYSTLALSTGNVALTNRTITGTTVTTGASLTVPTFISLQLDATAALNLNNAAATLTVNGDLQNAGTIDVGN
ncbi:MAG: hypothetical protein Q8L88_01615 [Bacteroidota bacterium]|nr:hypothetical protein [Bacteroidota bacterium]